MRGRYLVGSWAFIDPDTPQDTPLHLLSLDGEHPALVRPECDARAVYYGAVEPGASSAILLHNDAQRSAMSRLAWTAKGALVERGRWADGDEGGSYVTFDTTARYFAVANSHAGWSVFRNGETPERIARLQHEGNGPHPRQAHSHPHCIVFSPDNRWLYAVDMGADEVLAYPFDAESGCVGAKRIAFRAEAGSGPRHILFNADLAYLLNELGNTLVVLALKADGQLVRQQTVSTLPDDFTMFSHTAHLSFDPARNAILVSNRGHDSIACLELGPDGMVTGRHWSPSGGEWPWFFLPTGDGALLVANTLSDRISLLEPDGPFGFRVAEQISVRRPAFLARID